MEARPSANAAADEAIRRVLAAEAAAEGDVARAQREADAMREAARAHARAVAARTERRIRTMRERFEAMTRREVGDLDARCADGAAATHADAPDDDLVARAAAVVANELTGGGAPDAQPGEGR